MAGELMESEICEQPRLLAQNSKSYGEILKHILRDKRPEMVLLAARGSSDHAALYARYLIEIHLQIPVSLAAPSVLTRYKVHVRYPKCLAVGISQSGAAPDVAEVLASMREAGHDTLAITNTPGSRLTQAAEDSLILDAGPEKSVAATKTYSSSLLAMYQMVRGLGADLSDPFDYLPTEHWSDVCHSVAKDCAGVLDQLSPCFVLGRGYGFSTASEGALKLMECALIPARAYSTADFEHGPKALAGPISAVISYDGELTALEEQGARLFYAPNPPQNLPAPLRPLWEIFYGQWLALLAARNRGLNPDRPQFIQKITETT